MSQHPEEKEHLDFDDLTHSEVEEYVDDYFWGDDDIADEYEGTPWPTYEDLEGYDWDFFEDLEYDESDEDDDPAGGNVDDGL